MSAPDPRLLCDTCGEFAQVIPGPLPGAHVTAHRDGRVCCQAQHCPTEAEAVAAWLRLQRRSDAE